MKHLKVVLPTILLALSTSANASLIGTNDTDVSFLGAAQDSFNITLDTSTGLEWLDWSLTLNRSYDDVFAQTQGGSLDGWRYAIRTDFTGLATSAGISSSFFDNRPGGTDSGFSLLNGLLGSGDIIGESIAVSGSIGIFIDNTHALGGFLSDQTLFEIPNFTEMDLNRGYGDSNASGRVGHALVRDFVPSTVPVPAAAWLFGSALLGFFGFSRRKASA